MYQLAPNIELLFTEAGDYHDRVRAAAASGFTAVEMWGPTGVDAPSTPKDLPALKAALEETGTQLTAQLAEPRTQFMIPPWDHSEFYRKLDEGVEIAHFLGTPRMVVGSGTGFGGWKRQVQLDKLIEIYQKAIAQIDGLGHHARARAGQRARRPPRLAAGPHRARACTSRAASTRRSSACSTTSTTRPSRARMSRPSSRTPVDSSATCSSPTRPAAASRAPDRSTGRRRSATAARLRLRRTDRPRVLPDDRVGRVGEAHPAARGRRMSARSYPDVGRRRHRRQRPGRCGLRPHPERAGARRDDRDVRGRPDGVGPARRAREEHRRSRTSAPAPSALGGTRARASGDGQLARRRQERRSAGRGPARSCSRRATRSTARTACPSRRCRATSAAWPRTGPARARDRAAASASRFLARPRRAARPRPSGCSA